MSDPYCLEKIQQRVEIMYYDRLLLAEDIATPHTHEERYNTLEHRELTVQGMIQSRLYRKGGLDFQETLNQPVPSSHVRTSFMDAPKVTNPFFKDIRRGHEVTRMSTEFLLFEIKRLLSLLDGIASFLMGISVGNLVISAAIELDLATLASKEVFLGAANGAA
jgi:hypothetical protein